MGPTCGRAACDDVAVKGSNPLSFGRAPRRNAMHANANGGASDGERRRLLVVSHPAVVSVNQEVYRELKRRGWDVTIVVPSRWRHEYSAADITPQALDGF